MSFVVKDEKDEYQMVNMMHFHVFRNSNKVHFYYFGYKY